MANFKRTYINADEELVIQGKLTIEGELEQKEFVETSSFSQTNFSGDVLVVNADGFTKDVSPTATNSELKLRSGDANASLLFNSVAGTLTLSTSPAITTTLTVDGDISATDITASGTFTGALSGAATSAATATQLTTSRNFSIAGGGDVVASAVSFNGTTDVVLTAQIQTGAVESGMIGNDQVKPEHIDATVLTTHIGEGTNLYYTDARARAVISATSPIGYNTGSGAITFSGDSDDISQGSTNLYLSSSAAGDGLDYASGVINVDATVVRTSGTQSIAGAKTFTSSVVVPALTMPSASGGDYVAGDNTTKAASTAYVEAAITSLIDGAPGTLNTINEIAAALNDDDGIGADVISHGTRITTLEGSTTTLEGRTLTAGDGLSGGGTLAADRSFAVDSTVVRTSGTQTVAGSKAFSGTIIIPDSATATTGAIYTDDSAGKAYVYVDGAVKEITPAVDAGDVEDVGATGTNIYAGARTSGSTTYHGIRSLAGGTGVTVAESGNVVTVTTDAFRSDANVRALFSAVDASGDGTLSYNSGTGAFTYSGITDAQVRGKISGTGLIGYNSGTGVISTTADNYSSFTVRTDTGAGADEAISSGEVLTFVGGTNTTVTNSGNTITIRNDNDADIEAVTAGDGLSGGGSAGSVTLALDLNELTAAVVDVANDSIAIVDANDSNASRKETIVDLVTAMAGTNLTATNGVLSSTADLTGVGAGDGLSGGGTSGAISLALDLNELTAATVAVDSDSIAIIDASDASSKKESIADFVAGIAGSGLTASAGQLSISETGDIESVTAGTGLSGGGTTGAVTLNVSGLTTAEIAAGSLQLGSEAFSDSDSTLMTAAAVQDKIEAYGYTTEAGDITAVVAGTGLTGGATSGSATLNVNTGAVSNGASTIPTGDQVYDFVIGLGYTTEVGDITGVTAGTGLTGGGTSGAVTLNVSGLTVSELAAGSLQLGSEAFADNDTSLMTSAAIQDKIAAQVEAYGYSTTTGDITGVAVAGTGLSGGGTSGAVTITSNATSANTASTIVARDASGNFSAGTITATATAAQYADLAENYLADADYEVGTVVIIGGEQEITVTDEALSTKVAGVISSDPAYLMNADCGGEFPKPVALRGRIPVKVIGVVQKGDVLITSNNPGFAMSAVHPHDVSASEIVGKALGSKLTAGSGVIEALI